MNFDVKLYQDLTNARHRIEELEATVTSLKDRMERLESLLFSKQFPLEEL